jgi:N-acetylmuramoyl-L-alanine amidase
MRSAATIARMSRLATLVAALLLLAFAGCQTAPKPRPTGERPPDMDLGFTNPPVVVMPAPLRPTPPPVTNAAPPAPPAPAFAVPTGTWIQLGRWAEANRLGTLTNLNLGSPATFALKTTGGVFVVRIGSLLAQWSGLEVRLGYAPQLIGRELFVHTLDLQKCLIPLLSPATFPPAGARVIVLDPGHGGTDSGTSSSLAGRFEKEYTLDWAKRLKTLLEADGWTVHLTRTKDVEVSLPARVEFAEARKADLFLSLHFNATTGPDHAGIETYTTTPTGMPSSVTREFEDNVTMTFPNNRYDAQNLRLAVRVHREVLAAVGGRDRGVRHARFLAVLRGQNRPAVLIEGGYLSNPGEAKLVNTPEHRQKLAEAVARALE